MKRDRNRMDRSTMIALATLAMSFAVGALYGCERAHAQPGFIGEQIIWDGTYNDFNRWRNSRSSFGGPLDSFHVAKVQGWRIGDIEVNGNTVVMLLQRHTLHSIRGDRH